MSVHMPSESLFAGMKVDDRQVLENVVAVMQTMGKELAFSDYEVRSMPTGFVLLAKTAAHSMVSMNDLAVIKDCNPVRVQNVAVAWAEGNRLALHVKVLNSSTPVTITETDIIRVKRKRLFGFI